MYYVGVLIAAAYLLALTVHAAKPLIKAEAGRLPADYNKFKTVILPPYNCSLEINFIKLFNLDWRKPIAVRVEIQDPAPFPQPSLEIYNDLESVRVGRSLDLCYLPEDLYVAIEVRY